MNFKDIYEEILIKLDRGENFSFVRYGDGEWALILKNQGYLNLVRKWGESIEPFSDVLKNIVMSKPEYYFGIQNLGYNMYKEQIDPYLVDIPNLFDSDILHRRSKNDQLSDFLDIINGREVVIIGPEYLKNIKIIGFSTHIVTPEYHVWNQIEEVENKINDYISHHPNNKPVLLYSCSIVAKILIHKFHRENLTQIDLGSLLDPYVNVFSRRYHIDVLNRLNIPESTFIYPKIK